MDALVWGERFITGLGLIDQQHEHLFELVNAFGEMQTSTGEVSVRKLEALVEDLVVYARTHFVEEEAIMRVKGLDPRFVAFHCAEHSRFLHDVSHMQRAHFYDEPQTAMVLLSFLMNWLAFHILGTDMQLARQIKRVERGEAADAAFATEVRQEDGPAQLLLGAFDELLRVLSARNLALTDANRQLETRVAERTAELEGSLETLRKTQSKLLESEKLASVAQLASGMAHEINSPLAAVSTNLNVMGDYALSLLEVANVARRVAPLLPAAMRNSLDEAWRNGKLDAVEEDLGALVHDTREGLTKVKTILSDLKTFARVDAMTLSEVQVGSFVEMAMKMVTTAQREGVTFSTDLRVTPRVRCIGAQVNRAILSLLLNATQAVRDGAAGHGKVSVLTGRDGEFAFIEVKDDGVGMTREVLARAFEPFFTTRAPGKGTGLGLSSAYQCAQAHGGRLEALSEPGVGTTMRLLLSVTGAHEASDKSGLTNAYNTLRTSG